MQEYLHSELFDFMVNETAQESKKRLKRLPIPARIAFLEAAMQAINAIKNDLFTQYQTHSTLLMQEIQTMAAIIENAPNTLEFVEYKFAAMNAATVAAEHVHRVQLLYKEQTARLEAKVVFVSKHLRRYQAYERDAMRYTTQHIVAKGKDWHIEGATLVYAGTLKTLAYAIHSIEPQLMERYKSAVPRVLVEGLIADKILRLQHAHVISLQKSLEAVRRIVAEEGLDERYHDKELIAALRRLSC